MQTADVELRVEASALLEVADARGKHRIQAELKRLEQEARFLEKEMEELDKTVKLIHTHIVLMIVILTRILQTVKLIHTHPHQILALPVMIGAGGGRNLQKEIDVGARKEGGRSVVRDVEGGAREGQNASQGGAQRVKLTQIMTAVVKVVQTMKQMDWVLLKRPRLYHALWIHLMFMVRSLSHLGIDNQWMNTKRKRKPRLYRRMFRRRRENFSERMVNFQIMGMLRMTNWKSSQIKLLIGILIPMMTLANQGADRLVPEEFEA